jgi:trans-aconitate methyltransferase
MTSQEWSKPQLAEVYSQKAANPEVNWFEYEVNVPAMFSLMPSEAQKVLDFGCGAGDVTAMLAERFPQVEGCDPSQAMLDLSHKDFPALTFFEWDATKALEDKNDYYDAVFSKLAIHFVEDLRPVADQLFAVLKQGGSLIFSVPHPISTVRKTNGASYWQQTPYPTEIGSYGIQVTMIHRSLQNYVEPFISSGFVLTAADEPQIPGDIAKKYNATESDLAMPKRINFRFTKPTEVHS